MGKAPQSAIQQAPVPAPAPPVSSTADQVVQAGMDVRQSEMLKKGIKNTVKAGDTGGYKQPGMAGPAGGKVQPPGGNPFIPPQGKF